MFNFLCSLFSIHSDSILFFLQSLFLRTFMFLVFFYALFSIPSGKKKSDLISALPFLDNTYSLYILLKAIIRVYRQMAKSMPQQKKNVTGNSLFLFKILIQ